MAALNFLNHPLNSFTSVDLNSKVLNFANTGADFASAAGTTTRQYAQSGSAPLKEGRRILQLRLRYNL